MCVPMQFPSDKMKDHFVPFVFPHFLFKFSFQVKGVVALMVTLCFCLSFLQLALFLPSPPAKCAQLAVILKGRLLNLADPRG